MAAGSSWSRIPPSPSTTCRPAATGSDGPAHATSSCPPAPPPAAPRPPPAPFSPGTSGSYAEYITNGYFSLVALNFADTTALDHHIAADLRRNPHYHIIAVIPYGIEVPPIGVGTYVVWRYERNTRQQSGYTPRL